MAAEQYPPPGTVALVTGAGSGIGAATAERLVGLECRVICAGRRLDRVTSVAERIGGGAIALELDVTRASSVDTLLERCPDGYREIGVLVNNAGHDIGGRRPFHEGTAEQWAAIIDTNVTGLVRVTRALVPGMLERDYGHVVNLGSVSGIRPYATGTIYAASKHAVHGFSESLRLDYVGTGVRVTEILPGMVRTEFASTRWDDRLRANSFYDEFGECLEPEDIARLIAFAVSQPLNVVISEMVVMPRAQR